MIFIFTFPNLKKNQVISKAIYDFLEKPAEFCASDSLSFY